ncbi:hypothetical protein ACQCVB_11065 [Fictibacillus phosphorivorans]|uniref:hypothetical protein n=1 Tax=Fictibacillus phosphorivorans TaxID=1221500 RepID=UPI003CF2E95C
MKRYLNSESSKVILDTAKTIYSEENDRFKIAETKASILLAFTGVLANFYMQYIYRRITLEQLNLYDLFFIVINLLLILLLAYLLISSLMLQDFEQPTLDTVILYSYAEKDQSNIMLEIAATYHNVIKKNREVLKAKYDNIRIALFILIGLLIFSILHIFLKEVYFFGQTI